MRRCAIKTFITLSVSLFYIFSLGMGFSQGLNQDKEEVAVKAQPNVQQIKEQEFVGEFFDTKVPIQNYYFIKSVVAVFGYSGGLQPKTPEESEKYIWEQLLLSYEAFRRGIVVEQKEIDEEIRKMLEAEKVSFDWKQDKEAYEKWVKEKTNEPALLLENQLRHLLQVEKLRKAIMDSIEPEVSEKEAYREFLNEHSSLGVELVEFAGQEEADEFYFEVKKNPRKWDEERAARPADFKRSGSVSLEFLIDIWRFPRDAAYRMTKMESGLTYSPIPIYKGYAVCKILEKGLADKSRYKKLRDSYYEQIKARKRYEGLGKWFEDLKARSKIKVYETGEKGGAEK